MSDEPATPEQSQPPTGQYPKPSPADISQDKIHVTLPDMSKRTVAMKPGGMAIGRSPDNDIVLNIPGISRHHARIEFDGAQYVVRDLKSMNGTFIGKMQLQPDTPQPWLPGEDLIIGEASIRVERPSMGQPTTAVVTSSTQPSPTTKNPPPTTPIITSAAVPPPGAAQPGGVRPLQPVVRPDGSVIEDSQLFYSPAGTLAIYTATPNVTATPGKPTTISILHCNLRRSQRVDSGTSGVFQPAWRSTTRGADHLPTAPHTRKQGRAEQRYGARLQPKHPYPVG